jgi:hypothetical protein
MNRASVTVSTSAHQLLKHALGDWVPALIVLHVAVIAVVCAVADAPAVVRHQDAGVRDVANKVVQVPAVAEALVTAANKHDMTGLLNIHLTAAWVENSMLLHHAWRNCHPGNAPADASCTSSASYATQLHVSQGTANACTLLCKRSYSVKRGYAKLLITAFNPNVVATQRCNTATLCTHQSCPTTNSAQNMVPWAIQYKGHAHHCKSKKSQCGGR